jgi:hypothetical protein
LYYALSPNMGDMNNLPLIKLQEVFTPARPTNHSDNTKVLSIYYITK